MTTFWIAFFGAFAGTMAGMAVVSAWLYWETFVNGGEE